MYRRPPRSPLFPYTTLFRSLRAARPLEIEIEEAQRGRQLHQHPAEPRSQADAEALRREAPVRRRQEPREDRKSTRLNSSHVEISYAVFCLKKKRTDGPSRPP